MSRWLLLLCLLIAGITRADEARLELSGPEPRETVRGVLPLVEVAGRVRTGAPKPLDLLIALDVSESVFLPAGEDVDGDGVAGRMRVRRILRADGSRRLPRTWTTDPGDTVFEAERDSARRVLESIRTGTARVGLLSFSDDVRVRAQLGSAERALAALDAIRAPTEPRSTDLARAIRVGAHLLRERRANGAHRVLLLLSDGRATRPGPPLAADAAARRAARAAARDGIAIHAIAVGDAAAGSTSAFAELAALTAGRFAAARQLAALLGEPPFSGPTLALARVEIANATTGEPARALRWQEGGSFDAFVRLVPGRNRLRVRVRALDGSALRTSRTVYFEPPQATTPVDLALARAVRVRALEIELASLAAGARGAGRRLEIAVEP